MIINKINLKRKIKNQIKNKNNLKNDQHNLNIKYVKKYLSYK